MTQTVGIIGLGAVGSTIAYTLVTSNTCRRFVFYDLNISKAEGIAFDLIDTNHNVSVQVCDLENDAWTDLDIIVVAAGVKRSLNGSRLDLLDDNKRILESIFGVLKHSISYFTKVILVSNPVDIVTSITQKILSNAVPEKHIFGTGTLLDTYRLQSQLARQFYVKPSCIHVHVMGEHGDSQFVAWSQSHLGGTCLKDILSDSERLALEELVRSRAKSIIDRKGATTYGISTVVNDLVRAILTDERIIVPVSTYHPEPYRVCLSTLAVIGGDGIQSLLPLQLNSEEEYKCIQSAARLSTLLRKHDIM